MKYCYECVYNEPSLKSGCALLNCKDKQFHETQEEFDERIKGDSDVDAD